MKSDKIDETILMHLLYRSYRIAKLCSDNSWPIIPGLPTPKSAVHDLEKDFEKFGINFESYSKQ